MKLVDIERRDCISRLEFLEDFQFRKPLIVSNGAAKIGAFERWSSDYLREKIGHVMAQVYDYTDKRKDDYDRANILEISVAEYLDELERGNPKAYYWFNLANGIFKTNPLLQVKRNSALLSLADDFCQPSFLHEKNFVYSQIVLGGKSNSTKLHYDWGGEAKCFVHLRGKKSVRLISPQNAKHVRLNPISQAYNISACDINLFATDCYLNCEVLHADLREGDVLYWPSFWLHSLANGSPFTLSINSAQTEIPANPLFVRHVSAVAIHKLAWQAGDLNRQSLIDQANAMEEDILQKHGTTFWDWYC